MFAGLVVRVRRES